MTADVLSRVLAALADPTRRDIRARIWSGEAVVGEADANLNETLVRGGA